MCLQCPLRKWNLCQIWSRDEFLKTTTFLCYKYLCLYFWLMVKCVVKKRLKLCSWIWYLPSQNVEYCRWLLLQWIQGGTMFKIILDSAIIDGTFRTSHTWRESSLITNKSAWQNGWEKFEIASLVFFCKFWSMHFFLDQWGLWIPRYSLSKKKKKKGQFQGINVDPLLKFCCLII